MKLNPQNGIGKNSSIERKPERISILNIDFNVNENEIEDLFEEKVGGVKYVELLLDTNGFSLGAALVDFNDNISLKKALTEMQGYVLYGRRIHIVDVFKWMRSNEDTHGLPAQLLASLGIDGPLHNTVYVTNLSNIVNEKKLYEVFGLAGKILFINLYRDNNGKSIGRGRVVFHHLVEAVQAISMLHGQLLYNRSMHVFLAKNPAIAEKDSNRNDKSLPQGLSAVGKGRRPNGTPLKGVTNYLLDLDLKSDNHVTSLNTNKNGINKGAESVIKLNNNSIDDENRDKATHNLSSRKEKNVQNKRIKQEIISNVKVENEYTWSKEDMN